MVTSFNGTNDLVSLDRLCLLTIGAIATRIESELDDLIIWVNFSLGMQKNLDDQEDF